MQRVYGDFAANFNVNYSRISYSLQKLARWRSPLFFITEKDRNNRNKQKLLAGARLSSSLQKKTEITEINGIACLRQV